MVNVDVLAISECSWSCPDFGKQGVSLAYQPHIPVMQYTGLKDKNGKEIYDGDIIKHGESIRFIEVRGCNYVATRMDKSCTLLLSFSQSPEVIGNIHENPELQKGEG